MKTENIIGLLAVMAMVGMPTLAGLIAYGGLKKDVKSLSNIIDGLARQFLALNEKREKIDREVWPATKNGGIVTQEQFERRIEQVERGMATSFDMLIRRIDQLDQSNRSDHDITDASIERVVKKVIKKIKEDV